MKRCMAEMAVLFSFPGRVSLAWTYVASMDVDIDCFAV